MSHEKRQKAPTYDELVNEIEQLRKENQNLRGLLEDEADDWGTVALEIIRWRRRRRLRASEAGES